MSKEELNNTPMTAQTENTSVDSHLNASQDEKLDSRQTTDKSNQLEVSSDHNTNTELSNEQNIINLNDKEEILDNKNNDNVSITENAKINENLSGIGSLSQEQSVNSEFQNNENSEQENNGEILTKDDIKDNTELSGKVQSDKVSLNGDLSNCEIKETVLSDTSRQGHIKAVSAKDNTDLSFEADSEKASLNGDLLDNEIKQTEHLETSNVISKQENIKEDSSKEKTELSGEVESDQVSLNGDLSNNDIKHTKDSEHLNEQKTDQISEQNENFGSDASLKSQDSIKGSREFNIDDEIETESDQDRGEKISLSNYSTGSKHLEQSLPPDSTSELSRNIHTPDLKEIVKEENQTLKATAEEEYDEEYDDDFEEDDDVGEIIATKKETVVKEHSAVSDKDNKTESNEKGNEDSVDKSDVSNKTKDESEILNNETTIHTENANKKNDINLENTKTASEGDVEGEETKTTVVIDEQGIPQLTITTVPDRPPSSQASDSGQPEPDPFDDFGDFDEKSGALNTEDNKTTEESTHSEDRNNESVKNSEKSGQPEPDPFDDFGDFDEKSGALNTEESKTTEESTHSQDRNNDSVENSEKSELQKENKQKDNSAEMEENSEANNTRVSNKEDNQTKGNEPSGVENDSEHIRQPLSSDLSTEESDDPRVAQSNNQSLIEKDSNDTDKSSNDNSSSDKKNIDEQSNSSSGRDKLNKQVMDEHKISSNSNSDSTMDVNAQKPNNANTNNNDGKVTAEAPKKITEPEVKIISPLEQLLKRNVTIDGSVETIMEFELSVTSLVQNLTDVMKHYQEVLKLQSLKDFTSDLGKFRGDFASVNEAFKAYSAVSVNINKQFKELRHVTEDVKTQINRKFQNEDLSTWIDITPEQEKEKERLHEETIAAERLAMSKAAEARHAVATANVGVAEANKFVTEMELQMTEAEAVAEKASAQAEAALLAAEEARIAAEERRRVEEASRLRNEERARAKAIELEKQKAFEEKEIHMEAAKKGTSVEDERKQFMAEKERKEFERRNPNNWPRFTYTSKGKDFNPGIGCIIRAIDGSMRESDVVCELVSQASDVLPLQDNEELVSNIVTIKQVDEDINFTFEEPLSVSLPVNMTRAQLGREAVVKHLQLDGTWRELPTTDITFESYRETKFVEARCCHFGTFATVTRLKKDKVQFSRKGGKLLSSVDTRVSFTSKPGTFKQTVNSLLEVQNLDVNAITDLKLRTDDCEGLLTSSPFVNMKLPVRQFEKPLLVTVPVPQTVTRHKQRPATGIAREQKGDGDRPATARLAPANTEDDKPEDVLHFLFKDEKNGWTVNSKIDLVQPKNKDIVSFETLHPYERFLVLRTKLGMREPRIEKMAALLERTVNQRNVKIFLRQRHDDVSDVIVTCTSSKKADRALKQLEESGYVEGPNPSPDLTLHEGQNLYMKFRGNIHVVTENPDLGFIFNTHIQTTRQFTIDEKDRFAQKSLPCYRGFVQIFTKTSVPLPPTEGASKTAVPEMVEAEILLTELLVELPKPEAEPPKPLVTIPVPFKETPLTPALLRQIARELGKEWKDLAAHLNLKPMRIQAILRQNVNKDTVQTRYDMLVTWVKRIPKAMDKVHILSYALQTCGRPDLAEEVRYRGDLYKQQRLKSARASHLRQAFVKVAKTATIFSKWQSFAKSIGVPDEEIKRIDDSGGSGQDKCFTSLETWKNTAGEDATIPGLSTHLKKSRQDRLSRDVESILAT